MSDVANAAAPSAPAAPAPATVAPPVSAAPAAPAASAAVPVAPGVTINVQPAPAAASPASPSAAAPAVEPEPPQEGKEPPWLKDRLARAERSALKRLGVENEDDAKTALAAHKAKTEADKSAEAKAIEANTKLAAEQARSAELLAAVSATADTELARVTPAQREAVVRLAGDDPAKRLATLRALAPTWVTAAPAAPPPAVAQPASPPAAAPAAPAGEVPVTLIRLADGRLAQIVEAAPAAAPPPAAPPTGTQAIPPSAVSTAPPPGGPPAQAAPATTVLGKHASVAKTHPTAGAYFAMQNALAMERELSSNKP